MKIRLPWRRRVVASADEALLVRDTSALNGGEVVKVAPGRFVKLADLQGWPETVPTYGADELGREPS